jgi:hypothetical protein
LDIVAEQGRRHGERRASRPIARAPVLKVCAQYVSESAEGRVLEGLSRQDLPAVIEQGTT